MHSTTTKVNNKRIFLVAIRSMSKALEYSVPEHLIDTQLHPGMRVLVPYRNQQVVGLLLKDITSSSDLKKHKAIIQVVDTNNLYKPTMVQFLLRVAKYYNVGDEQVIPLTLCAKAWTSECFIKDWCTEYKLTQEVQLATGVKPALKKCLNLIAKKGGHLAHAELIRAKVRDETINQAKLMKLIEPVDILNSELKVDASHWIPTTQQQKIIDAIIGEDDYRCHYLYGVTGSGKTCIYALAAAHWAHMGQVLWMVPEISITPQLITKLHQQFGDQAVVSYHSGLSERERYHAWLDITTGRARVIIGTRSSIFLPFYKLQGIIIDEEHDSSFKQQSGLRYSARGVACLRAKTTNIPILLGSATPSLTCLAMIARSDTHFYQLYHRYGGVELPEVTFVDMQKKLSEVGISQEVLSNITDTLAAKKQVLLFINRRGYAPCWWCQSCHKVHNCSGCDRPVTYHHNKQKLACHRCDITYPIKQPCSHCGATNSIPLGVGTEKITQFLQEKFTDTPVLQIDRDTCNSWQKLQRFIQDLHDPQPKITVATQMVIKSHHIPNLHRVIVVDADYALLSKDFRALEHLHQQMHQVIGRAGREAEQGVINIQTAYPDHPIWSYIKAHNYLDGAKHLLSERQQLGLPPYSHQALICLRHKQEGHARRFANQLWHSLKSHKENLVLYKPMPSQYAKLHGYYGYTVLMQAKKPAVLGQYIAHIKTVISELNWPSSLNWYLDTDPIEW